MRVDVEAFIKTSISQRYPDHAYVDYSTSKRNNYSSLSYHLTWATDRPLGRFVGEESYSKGSSRHYLINDSTPTWCVDPLDGTVNYTHLFPMFCVSIAFVVGGMPVIGVVSAPMLGQLFTACRGRGAWLNETHRLPLLRDPTIPPLPAGAPTGCIFSCEWGKDRKDHLHGNLYRKVESFLNMAAELGGRGGKGGMVHGVRSLGR